MKLAMDRIESPIGTIIVVASSDAMVALEFETCTDRMVSYLRGRFRDMTLETVSDPNGYSSMVRAYFGGDLNALQTVTTDGGGTPFQQQVWAALRSIPPGETRSYGELAGMLGRPSAARAVGMANSRNPIAVVVPCHRVIGADQTLTGYAGGIERKRWLLAHEGIVLEKETAKLNSAAYSAAQPALF